MKTIKNKAHTIKNTVSTVLDFMKLTLTIVLNITKNKEEMRDTIAYGASVGKIDEDHLYYLQSRGLSKQDAMHLVTYGYFLPVLEFISVDSLKERFSDVLKEKVGL